MIRNIRKAVLIASSLFAITACTSNSSGLSGAKLLRSPEGLSHVGEIDDLHEESFRTFEQKMNSFAFDISEKFIDENFLDSGNVCLSPLSISQCLSLAVCCSYGETRQELLNVLGVSYEELKEHFKMYFNSLWREYFDEKNVLESALYLTNSIWFDNDAILKDDCLDDLKDNYYCYSYEVDFNGNNKGANNALKEFIKKQTKGLIDPPMNLKPNTLLVLMNTLYLKDIWNDEGLDLTIAPNEYTFTNLNGKKSSKKLLQSSYLEGKTMETENFSCFSTCTNHGYRLFFVKPNEGKQLKDVFTKDNIKLATDLTKYTYRDDNKKEVYYTNCIFPEYKAECDKDIKDILAKEYNVRTLFDDSCNFTNVTENHVYCDQIQHIAKLNVDKKGIEGAAVTYMAMPGKGMPPEEEYKEVYETFVVDKEFGFVLTNSRGAVLFTGTTTNID